MKPDKRFVNLPKSFWSNVRSISQARGYTDRTQKKVRTFSIDDMRFAMKKIGLGSDHIVTANGKPKALGKNLIRYFEHRAHTLNTFVESRLMNLDEAKSIYEDFRKRLKPRCPLPMNKQKKEKKGPAYFTCIINMLIEANIDGHPCDYDPRQLTMISKNSAPLRTLSRRLDGAFPGPVNPLAIWEIKEYYYTTTFGSRVADGVYVTLLDGMELEEISKSEKIDIEHYLMIDAYYTWWDCGRSYLCRIFDMLHMGYIDEVLFGREVCERIPEIVKSWVKRKK